MDRSVTTAWRAGAAIVVLAVMCGLSACADRGSDMSQQDLSLACEMHKCDCAPDGQSFTAGVPVLWQLDGSAYCPKSYHLRMLDLPPSQKMVT
jgi:hypothetical protein